MNYYDILGIPKSASMAEIRAAYLIQIKYFHPDVFPGNPEIAKVKTTQLNEAYFVLSNAARRAAYDRTLIQEAESASAPPPPPPYQRQPYHSYSGAADNANPAGQNSQQNPKEESNSPDVTGFGKIAGVIFILILIIALAAYRNASNNPDPPSVSQPAEESAPSVSHPAEESAPSVSQPAEEPVLDFPAEDDFEIPPIPPEPLPANGEILYGQELNRVAPFSVVTMGYDNFFVKLKTRDGERTIMSFFVRAGETANVDVPLGEYTLYYATGETWYGPELVFGDETIYYKADETFDFYEEGGYINGWTVELYLQFDGNLSTDTIDPDEF